MNQVTSSDDVAYEKMMKMCKRVSGFSFSLVFRPPIRRRGQLKVNNQDVSMLEMFKHE